MFFISLKRIACSVLFSCLLIPLSFCLSIPRNSFSSECISSFKSAIQVNRDGSLRVTERIAVHAEGKKIRHGIYREFPTRYGSGYRHFVSFTIESIQLDGKPVAYHVEHVLNGVRIYIGEENTLLRPGYHWFNITYVTNRQLGMFETHDELYWNVTGQGWKIPIDSVSATVKLPETVPAEHIKAQAYAGFTGSTSQDGVSYDIQNGRVTFTAKRIFLPQEGLTIVVGWPKGIIEGPSIWERITWFFLDLYNLIALCILLILVVWGMIKWRIMRTNALGTVIPLFEPPKGMTPGMIRALLRYKYDAQCFTADVVNWAVYGLLSISYKNNVYTLTQIKNDLYHGSIPLEQRRVIQKLFLENKNVTLTSSYNDAVDNALQAMKASTDYELRSYHDDYEYERRICYGVALICSAVTGLVSYIYYGNQPLGFYALFAYWFITLFLVSYYRGYTEQGKTIRDEVEGFKLFLKTTEEERLKIIGTPPTKTPELYEKYLPYAIALGVEKQWTKKFAPVFEQRERETGIAYKPVWYHGPIRGYGIMSPSTHFSSHLKNSLSSVISSSSKAPGSSSGFGGGSGGRGGGSAGGGGGGGGGGGW